LKVVTQIADLEHSGQVVGFVPTMGALHEGHLSLMRKARTESDCVVASLFVNPTQFGKNEDFDKYPRHFDRDADLAASVGVDVLFAPSVQEVYPRTSSVVHVPEVTSRWEGAHRPGHFDGVSTVVCKLLNIVRPTKAYFGLKDFQQCRVIERMVEDLNMPVHLSFEETVREPDGLAMSSRNMYLSHEERQVAPLLHQQLLHLRTVARGGHSLKAHLEAGHKLLVQAGFVPDYLALVRWEDLSPIDRAEQRSALIVAARLGKTRLIDNLLIY
jgi:pantoate--beta-alanine ligase